METVNSKGAWRGDHQFKAAMLAEVEKHRQADAFVQDIYGESAPNAVGFKGCAIGCSIHSFNVLQQHQHSSFVANPYDGHDFYNNILGIPEGAALANLEDAIFYGLPFDEARGWPGRFFEAIPVGADLSLVVPTLKLWLLTDNVNSIWHHADEGGKAAIETIADLYTKKISGQTITEKEWRDAASATVSAVNAAETLFHQVESEKLLELLRAAPLVTRPIRCVSG